MPSQIAGQHFAGLGRPERRFVSDVLHHANERRRVESGALPHRFDELNVVLRRLRSMQPEKRAEEDEYRTQALRQQLEAPRS